LNTRRVPAEYVTGTLSIVLALLVLIAFVNPRDFPFDNLPLFYPALVLTGITIGHESLLRGTRCLGPLVPIWATYWTCFFGARLAVGESLPFEYFGRAGEMLALATVGAAIFSMKRGAATLTSAILFACCVSTAFGLLALTGAGPLASVKATIHRGAGSLGESGEAFIDEDVADRSSFHNTGLSRSAFLFSYQLSAAAVIACARLAVAHRLGWNVLPLTAPLVLVVAGVLTNAERSSLLFSSVAVMGFLLTSGKRHLKRRLTALAAMVLVVASSAILVRHLYLGADSSEMMTLFQRVEQAISGETLADDRVRLQAALLALESPLHEPIGNGAASAFYTREALNIGWTSNGLVLASHNHFANQVDYLGFLGYALVIWFASILWRMRRLAFGGGDAAVVLWSLSAVLANGLTHNAGLFTAEPATCLLMGAVLAAASANHVKRHDGAERRACS
jgi:hypothetical protein